MITQICIGFSGSQLEACHKAFEAASIQTQVKRNVELAEKTTSDLVFHKVTAVTGESVWVGTGIALKVVRDRSVTYPILRNPNGVMPSITPSMNLKAGLINFGWRF